MSACNFFESRENCLWEMSFSRVSGFMFMDERKCSQRFLAKGN